MTTYDYLCELDGPTAEDIAELEKEAEQLSSVYEF